MSDNVELHISEQSIQHLRCSICEGYLSCAPIRILPDGNNVCGRCSPLDTDVLTYRQLTLEALLSNSVFPCKYKEQGCTVRLEFGCTIDHEDKCTYRSSAQLGKHIKKPPVSEAGSAMDVQETTMKSSASVTTGEKPKCSVSKSSSHAAGSSNLTLSPSPHTDALPSTSSFARNSNASPARARSETRTYNEWNYRDNASTSSNRGHTWTPPPGITAFDMRWNQYGPRRDWHFTRPRGGRRNLYFHHKRSNRNSVVVIKGGTFYINL